MYDPVITLEEIYRLYYKQKLMMNSQLFMEKGVSFQIGVV